MKRLGARVLFSTTLLVTTAVMGSTGSAGATPACGTLLPLAVPACGALWGISVPGGSAATLAKDENTVGREFDIAYHFHQMNDAIPTADERSEAASGHLLHINIESVPYSYAQVASGGADSKLIADAKGIAALGVPVYVTFNHEPDVKNDQTRGTPAQFVAAWRHVHDVFVQNGASNAVWVWVTTGWYLNFPSYASYYPGNDDVDWISWEAYSTTACPTTTNRLKDTFSQSVGPMYTWLSDGHGAAAGIDVSKPEMISEYGAVYDSAHPAAQGAWYQSIPGLLQTKYPNIKAIAKWDNPGGNCQYQMSVNPQTVAGVTAAGHDPYVNQAPPPPQQPTAAFTDQCGLLACTFDSSSSAAPGSSITSWAWDFGDGVTSTDSSATHTFAGSGTYPVTLTVTNADNLTDSTTQNVTVSDQQTPISFVAATSTTANATSESVTVPAAVSAGNGLVLIATGAAGSALTGPTGWTQVGSASTSSIASAVWERVATSTDPGSTVTVKFPSQYKGSVHLLAYSGTNQANPVVAFAGSTSVTAGTSYRTPTTTSPLSGDVVVSAWAAKSSAVTGWTVPAGQTVRSTANNSGGGRINSVVADGGQQNAGPVGGLTATTDVSGTAFAGWTIVLG